MLPITGTLPASKTHRERRWAFTPTSDITQPGLGTLTLVQGKRDLDSYGIDIEEGQLLFAKLDESAEVYGVSIRCGTPTRCTCTGFHFTKKCKHLDAARELIADGILDAQPA
jgi:hypothetical protein